MATHQKTEATKRLSLRIVGEGEEASASWFYVDGFPNPTVVEAIGRLYFKQVSN